MCLTVPAHVRNDTKRHVASSFGKPSRPQSWTDAYGAEWTAILEAAIWAWPIPDIGRKLYGIARHADFSSVALQVLTKPDTDGRLLGMIKTVAGYARESGAVGRAQVDAMLQAVERALAEETYLAVTPQFVVTAIR